MVHMQIAKQIPGRNERVSQGPTIVEFFWGGSVRGSERNGRLCHASRPEGPLSHSTGKNSWQEWPTPAA